MGSVGCVVSVRSGGLCLWARYRGSGGVYGVIGGLGAIWAPWGSSVGWVDGSFPAVRSAGSAVGQRAHTCTFGAEWQK